MSVNPIILNGLAQGYASLPRRVRNILSKYQATALIPGAGEPILGPELVVNGDGSTLTGWSQIYNGTTVAEAGRFKLTNTSGGYGGISRGIALEIGKTYQLSADYGHVDGTGFVTIATTPNGAGQRFAPSPLLFGSQTYRNTFVATVANVFATVSQGGTSTAGTVAYFDNISVREILSYTNTYSSFVSGNYVESTGQNLTPVDGAVGLVVDAARSEIPMTAPSTGSTAGWTSYLASLSTNGTDLTVTNTSAAEGYAYFQQGNILAGRTYRLEFEVVSRTLASGTVQVGQTTVTSQSIGKFSASVKATNTHGIWIGVGGTTIGNSVTIRNVRLWELPGNHATQGTTQNKPVLLRGLVNLLTYSNNLSNAAWVVTGTASKSGSAINLPAVNDAALQATSITVQAGGSFTSAFMLSGSGTVTVELYRNDAGTAEGYSYSVDLSSTPTLFTAPFTFASSHTSIRSRIIRASGNTATSVTFHSAALFAGTVTAQQILAAGGIPVTTSAPASSAVGPQYWQFDGVDDRLTLSAVPFQMADDHFVVVGATRGATGATRRLFHVGHSNDIPRVACVSFTSDGKPEANWRNTAGNLVSIVGANTQPEQPVVLSATSISLAVKLRADSSLIASGVNPGGDTTLTLASIGAHTVPSAFHNGHIHGVIFGKGAISDSELLTLERFAAKLQGRSI